MRLPRLLGLLAFLLAPAVAEAGAVDQLYDRTVMSAADDRCRLFTPDLGHALDAARLQARGAALRGGAADAQVLAIERRARARAAAAPCRSPDVALAAGRVREAFEGWRDVGRMDFPGERQGWSADRAMSREPRWRVRQDARVGHDRATLGVGGARAEGALVAAVEGAPPASARLIVRHIVRSPRPVVAGTLAQRGARGPAARVFPAQMRLAAPAGLRSTRANATAFRFSAEAMTALAALDSRESVAVEFADARGGVRTAWFEVGDFAAAQAFIAAGRR